MGAPSERQDLSFLPADITTYVDTEKADEEQDYFLVWRWIVTIWCMITKLFDLSTYTGYGVIRQVSATLVGTRFLLFNSIQQAPTFIHGYALPFCLLKSYWLSAFGTWQETFHHFLYYESVPQWGFTVCPIQLMK